MGGLRDDFLDFLKMHFSPTCLESQILALLGSLLKDIRLRTAIRLAMRSHAVSSRAKAAFSLPFAPFGKVVHGPA